MSVIEPGPASSVSLVARAQGILLHPKAEWEKIDAEPATIQGLYIGYVCILAAIPAIATLIGSEAFGHGVLGIVYRPPIIGAVVMAIIAYVLALVGVFVLALIIDALAPSFDGQKNQIQAFKIAAYSGTAGWVAGIFAIFPPLGALAWLGSLYGLYLLFVGLPKLMKAPEDKALGYTAVTIIVSFVISLAIGLTAGAVGGMAMLGAGGFGHGEVGSLTGTVHLPGGASVDVAKLDAASKAMQASAAQMQAATAGQPAAAGAIKAVAPDSLKALLPDSLPAGFARTEVSATSAGAAGVGGSHAEGVYTKGGGQITLQVTDLAAMGALAALGGAIDVNSSKETATGYEKVGKVDGRLTTEEFDRQSHSGKYSVVVDDRFVVEADGSGVDIDALKGAVGAIGFDRLTGLAAAA
jgi:hypothetical protein